MKPASVFLAAMLLLSAAPVAFSQTSVRNLNVEITDFTGKTYGPQDPLNDSLLVTVTFNISDFEDLDTLNYRYGTSRGAADIFNWKLTYLNHRGQDCLTANGRLFRIVDGKVTLFDTVGKETLLKPAFFQLAGMDKGGSETGSLTRQYR